MNTHHNADHGTRTGTSRRGLLAAGAMTGLTASGTALLGSGRASAAPRSTRTDRDRVPYVLPQLTFADEAHQRRLGRLYDVALTDLVGINTVYAEPDDYNQSQLLSYPPGTLVRAGGGYPAPQRWTRDAAVNAWSGVSATGPVVARNTLYSVLDRQDDGGHIVQQDNQWWDQVVWIVSAWHHYRVTGDDAFLRTAYAASTATIQAREKADFNADHGLFQGPGFMNDGIAGYPSPPWERGIKSSFVLDYPGADRLMCLSTNCLYHGAYRALAAMAAHLGEKAANGAHLGTARRLRAAIHRGLWRESAGTYAYFVHGDDALAGRLDTHQEGAGLALAVLMGVADRARTARLLESAHWQPHGIVNVWPAFPLFDDDRPGRHNVMVWPMVHGLFGHAAAAGGRPDLFARAVEDLAGLVTGSGDNFYELYHSETGAVDGGWQTGGDGELNHFTSQPDQAWSASAYLRLIHDGLFGITYEVDGVSFAPTLPAGWGTVSLTGLAYRDQTLDVTVSGGGNRVRRCTVDGRSAHRPFVDADGGGHHSVAIELG